MLKHLTFSEQKKMPVHEVDLAKVLAGFEMEMDQVSSGLDACSTSKPNSLFFETKELTGFLFLAPAPSSSISVFFSDVTILKRSPEWDPRLLSSSFVNMEI